MQRGVADVMNVPIEAEQIVQDATSIHQSCIYSSRTFIVACRKIYMVFTPRFEATEAKLQDGCFLAAVRRGVRRGARDRSGRADVPSGVRE